MAQSILIRTPNHLGDCIMALPMINETGEAHPGAQVTILVPETLADLYKYNPAVDHILSIPTQHVHGLIAVMKIKDIISAHQFDIGYVLPPSFGAAAGFKLGGVKKRIGYIADGRRLMLSKSLPLPAPLNSEHRSKLYFNLLLRGAGVEMEFTRPKLFLNDDDMAAGSRILSGFGIADDHHYAVVTFRAVAESRRWGQQNYTDLIKQIITKYGLKVVLTGSTADQREGDAIAASASAADVVNLAGKTSLRESSAIMSRAAFFVGNDSGGAHLAAAVGCPLVVLSGADDPKSTSPMAANKRLVYLDHLGCISCVKNRCPLKGEKNMICMKGISVDMVMQQIESLLSPADHA
jgi:lipopolysaccharide heptosyltransferase II